MAMKAVAPVGDVTSFNNLVDLTQAYVNGYDLPLDVISVATLIAPVVAVANALQYGRCRDVKSVYVVCEQSVILADRGMWFSLLGQISGLPIEQVVVTGKLGGETGIPVASYGHKVIADSGYQELGGCEAVVFLQMNGAKSDLSLWQNLVHHACSLGTPVYSTHWSKMDVMQQDIFWRDIALMLKPVKEDGFYSEPLALVSPSLPDEALGNTIAKVLPTIEVPLEIDVEVSRIADRLFADNSLHFRAEPLTVPVSASDSRFRVLFGDYWIDTKHMTIVREVPETNGVSFVMSLPPEFTVLPFANKPFNDRLMWVYRLAMCMFKIEMSHDDEQRLMWLGTKAVPEAHLLRFNSEPAKDKAVSDLVASVKSGECNSSLAHYVLAHALGQPRGLPYLVNASEKGIAQAITDRVAWEQDTMPGEEQMRLLDIARQGGCLLANYYVAERFARMREWEKSYQLVKDSLERGHIDSVNVLVLVLGELIKTSPANEEYRTKLKDVLAWQEQVREIDQVA